MLWKLISTSSEKNKKSSLYRVSGVEIFRVSTPSITQEEKIKMNKIQMHNKMSYLRREYEKMMVKVTASKYDLVTLGLDKDEEEMLKSQIQHQQWAADDILKRIAHNADKFREEENNKS